MAAKMHHMAPPLIITPLNGGAAGRASFGSQGFPVCIGRGGLGAIKHEGDGRSPRGRYRLEYGLYRSDRLKKPITRLPMLAITPAMGWCDDPRHGAYNALVNLPFSASHEKMWREDGLYDLVLVISHNRRPPIKGLGSAIFLHCMAEPARPTEGCAAFPKDRLAALVRHLAPGTQVRFGA